MDMNEIYCAHWNLLVKGRREERGLWDIAKELKINNFNIQICYLNMDRINVQNNWKYTPRSLLLGVQEIISQKESQNQGPLMFSSFSP